MQEEIELLEELTPPLDMAKIHSGDISPVYFGSAMNNFGVGFVAILFLFLLQSVYLRLSFQIGGRCTLDNKVEYDALRFSLLYLLMI